MLKLNKKINSEKIYLKKYIKIVYPYNFFFDLLFFALPSIISAGLSLFFLSFFFFSELVFFLADPGDSRGINSGVAGVDDGAFFFFLFFFFFLGEFSFSSSCNE